MLAFSIAKINLGLNILSKRSDGYHNIESVFYPIPWADILEVLPAEKFGFKSSGLTIPGDVSSNLIVKAYNLLKDEVGFKKNVAIYLHKILPMGAGLGGGSSNGAFALKLINDVLKLGLSNRTLEEFAARLGSDCAFFIDSKPKFCLGRGNEFEEIDLSLKGMFIVLVNPEIHISTQEAFSRIVTQKPEIPVKEIIKMPIETWKDVLKNDFEKGAISKYPLIATIKEDLCQKGAVYAAMTGSGSTVFGIFREELNYETDFVSWSGKLK